MIDATRALHRDPLAFLTQAKREGGDFAPFRVGSQQVLLVSDPSSIRELLAAHDRNYLKQNMISTTGVRHRPPETEGLMSSDDHDRHLRGRRIVSPAFAAAETERLLEVVDRRARPVVSGWVDEQTIEVGSVLSQLTIAIVGEAVFATELAGRATELDGQIRDFVEGFSFVTSPGIALRQLAHFGRGRRFRSANRSLLACADELSRRGASSTGAAGLLDRAEAAGTIDAQRRRRDTFSIFLAGVETTANALAWTAQLLAAHPEVSERIGAEANGVLDGRRTTDDTLQSLTTARGAFAEALRLYPPSWFVARRALSDQDLGGHAIPEGTIVLTSPFLVHRDERWFDRPEEFRPERWEEPRHPASSYFPFGAGPHRCLGERLAWIEGTVVTALMASRWRLVPAAASVAPRAAMSLQPSVPIRVRVQARVPQSVPAHV